MDILSLPNEMLTSVLKYLPHKPLQKVRRINRRLDEISKRSGLNRLVPTRLSVYNGANVWLCIEPDRKYYNRKMAEKIQENFNITPLTRKGKDLSEENINQLLRQVLSKIRKLNYVTFSRSTINEETVQTILKYKKVFRNAKLDLYQCHLDISAERFKNVVNALTVSQISVCCCQFTNRNGFTDKVVADFNPSMNIMLFGMDCSLLTIDSLYKRVYSDRLNISIGTSTTIKFWDMITFLKSNKTIKNDITIGEVHGDLKNAAEVEEILTKEFNTDDITHCGTTFAFQPYPDQGVVRLQIRFINIGE